jgi:putative transposase
MDQKTQFIADYLRRSVSISELCTNFGISRKTGYKWIDRYLHDGPEGLEDRSTKPYTAPNCTPPHIVDALIELRIQHPLWGAGKLLAIIERRHRGWEPVAALGLVGASGGDA